MRICPNCSNEVSENAVFCDQCGVRLPVEEPIAPAAAAEQPAGGVPEGVVVCAACGAENVPGEIFCDVCGEPLEAPAPAEAVVEVAVAEAAVAEAVMVEEVVAEPVEAAVVEEVVEVVEEAGAVEQERYCPVCGSIVHAGDTFCGSCGAVLDEMGTLAEQTTEVVTTEAPIEPAVAVVEPAVAEVVIEEAPVQEAVIEEAPVQEAVAEEAVVEEVVVAEALIAEQPVVEEQVVEELHCSVCGASVLPDQAFCASCGAALQAVEKVAEAVAPQVALAGPYLEIVESGAHIPLVVQDALLIGRADEISGVQPDVDMTPHRGMEGGVSRRHAQLLHEAGKWFIVDLDSTNGTYLNGAEVQPKARQPLNDGDRIGLGDVEAVFHAG